MELQEVKKKLSEIELRIAEREKESEKDKTTLLYLRGYLDGLDSLINHRQSN